MENDLFEYSRIFIGLYALVAPPIVAPLFLSITTDLPRGEKIRAARLASLCFAGVMILFVFTGKSILEVFGISLPAFRIAGGFLLLLIALDMMRATVSGYGEDNPHAGQTATALAIVPLTIPIMAGPGAISTVVLFATDNDGDPVLHLLGVSGVIVLIAVLTYFTLRLAAQSDRLFTPDVALVFSKVMGLLIAAIAFEFIMQGISDHFPFLQQPR